MAIAGGCTPYYRGERVRYAARGTPAVDEWRAADTQRAAAITEARSDRESAPLLLTLPQVIRLCLLNDGRIRAAVESIEQARADVTTSSLLPNPTLSISQTLNPFLGAPFDATNNQGGPPQLDVELAYSLDALLFGKRNAAIAAAQRGVDVAIAQHADLARQRVIEAITAYFDVLEARELLRLAREEFEQLQRLESITERRVTLGSVGQIEADRFRVAVLAGRRRMLQAQATLDIAQSELRARLGRFRGVERAEAAGELTATVPPEPPSLERVLAIAEQHRPDFVAAQRQAAQARLQLTAEQRAALPSVSVRAVFTRQFQEQAIGFPDVSAWGVGLDVSVPLFDRNQGNIARSESSVRQADLQIEAARVDLRNELEQAIRHYRAAREIVTTVNEESLQSASAARRRVEESYALGGRTLIEVLDAQAAYREAFREHVQWRAQLLRALHRLNTAAGAEVLTP